MDNDTPSVDIPARRVKKRRVINQPLSDLALQIIREAMGNYKYAFTGRFGDAPLARNAMASALRGTKKLVKGVKVTRTPGICELLGLQPFTPHDLRRTAATMCGESGPAGGRYLALPRPSGEQGRKRQTTASGYPQGLQPRHASPGSEETRRARCMGGRTAPDRRRAYGNWAASRRLTLSWTCAEPAHLSSACPLRLNFAKWRAQVNLEATDLTPDGFTAFGATRQRKQFDLAKALKASVVRAESARSPQINGDRRWKNYRSISPRH